MRITIAVVAGAVFGLVGVMAMGQDAGTDTGKSADQSAEQVLNELLQRRAENPIIEPAKPAVTQATPGAPGAKPAIKTGSLMGTAPGAAPVQLKREGSFVIMRKGRLVRGEGGLSPWLFVFDADKDGLSDPPMFVSPCQALEDMESVISEHGDSMVFTISGQVFVYRQANYLLVTLWKLTPDRGNLQP